MRRPSFLNQLLSIPKKQHKSNNYQSIAKSFLGLCKVHDDTARQHHDFLVSKFITQPSACIEKKHYNHLTASGPPLPVLLKFLEKLRDLRMATTREDISTRYHDLCKLKATLT